MAWVASFPIGAAVGDAITSPDVTISESKIEKKDPIFDWSFNDIITGFAPGQYDWNELARTPHRSGDTT